MHYTGVIMSAMASQIIGVSMVWSAVYSDGEQRKHQSSAPLAFFRVTGKFPSQRANFAEKVSIWLRHHGFSLQCYIPELDNVYIHHIIYMYH